MLTNICIGLSWPRLIHFPPYFNKSWSCSFPIFESTKTREQKLVYHAHDFEHQGKEELYFANLKRRKKLEK